MSKVVACRQLEAGDFVLEGYGNDDQLLISDYEIDRPEDLEKLENMGVQRCMIRTGDQSSQDATSDREEIPADQVTQDDLDDISNQIEQTSRVYEQTEDQLDGVFQSVQDGSFKRKDVDELKGSVEQFVNFAEESRASISALTQLEDYDDHTLNHSLNVCLLSLLYGLEAEMDRSSLEQLGFAALVHDIGKTRLPRSLINKPGNLNDDEWDQIKDHPEIGAEVLSEMDYGEDVINIARQHHERPDGDGYPRGLTEIDRLARIISVCDVYEALTGLRSYRNPDNPVSAYKTLRDEFGTFPSTQSIVNKFIRCLGLFPVGSLVRLTNNDLAVVKENDPDHLDHPVVMILENKPGETTEKPYKVDLHRCHNNKQLHQGQLYDDGVEIKSVIQPSQTPDLDKSLSKIISEDA